LGAVEVARAFVAYAVFLLPAVSASFNEMVAGMFVGMLLLAGLQFAGLLRRNSCIAIVELRRSVVSA
jgi:hypothetical protein